MPELEEKIVWWRENLPTPLRNAPSTVAELEEHIREDVVRFQRKGMSVEAAFDAAMRSLGDPREIAREFDRVGASLISRSPFFRAWLLVTVIAIVAMNSFLAWAYFRSKIAPLLFVHVAVIGTGYLVVLGNGLLGLWELIAPLWRSFGLAEQRELRGTMLWLSTVAGVLMPIGVVLGIYWAAGNTRHAWSWQPAENGALLVLGSSWLLLLAQTRLVIGDQARALVAILGGIASVVGFAAKALTPVVSVGWLCIALALSQSVVLALWRSTGRGSTT